VHSWIDRWVVGRTGDGWSQDSLFYLMITVNDGPLGYEMWNDQLQTVEIANMFACNKHNLLEISHHIIG
jgi:hypothetical protein